MGALLDLILPSPCPCGAAAGPVCVPCQASLRGAAAVVRPYPAPRGLPVCAAATEYAGPVRRLLIAYKERGRRDVARVLAQALLSAVSVLPAVAESAGGPVLLVPVPASRAARRARGVDHVRALVALAVMLSRERGGDRLRHAALLQPARRVADQAGLSAPARAANVAHSLRVSPGPPPRAAEGALVVVVDDVLTTGATLAEAARALRAGGYRPAGAAVVAAAVLQRAAVSPRSPLSRGAPTV